MNTVSRTSFLNLSPPHFTYDTVSPFLINTGTEHTTYIRWAHLSGQTGLCPGGKPAPQGATGTRSLDYLTYPSTPQTIAETYVKDIEHRLH